MAIIVDTRFIENVDQVKVVDVTGTPIRGGIVLEASVIWNPYTFLNIGTVTEAPVGGNVEFILGSTAGTSITSIEPLQYNVVPQNGRWVWSNPYSREIQAASPIIEKLRHSNVSAGVPGLINEGSYLRYVARPDPYRAGIHSIEIHVTMLAFDDNIL